MLPFYPGLRAASAPARLSARGRLLLNRYGSGIRLSDDESCWRCWYEAHARGVLALAASASAYGQVTNRVRHHAAGSRLCATPACSAGGMTCEAVPAKLFGLFGARPRIAI